MHPQTAPMINTPPGPHHTAETERFRPAPLLNSPIDFSGRATSLVVVTPSQKPPQALIFRHLS
jgi:hypothetical protein